MDKNSSELAILAKQKLMNFVGEIDKRLSFYWQEEIEKNFGFSEPQKKLTREMILHSCEHNLRTSKRLRSALVYYGWKLGISDISKTETIWRACEGVELIHTSLLMHDDFMDKDKVRRGKPTTQEYFANGDMHYGNSMAVCVGDSVLCLGFERFMEVGEDSKVVMKSLKQLMRGIANTAFGQAFDTYLQRKGVATEDDILALQISKTGIYTYENPLLAGAILAGLDDKTIEILKEYSKYAGIAFQMQDDILGIFGDEERTGKSSDSDIRQGKITFVYLKTLDKLDGDDKKHFLSLWGNENINAQDIAWIKAKIIETEAKTLCVHQAREYANKAVEVARKLRNKNLNIEAIDFLEGIAAYMVEREV